LMLHNQIEAARVNQDLRDMTGDLRNLTGKLKDLTQNNVDDSTAIKVITFISAVYLPGSFVASLYGMNFFIFDHVKKKIAIANDFWVFIATWLPLTMVTAAMYIVILRLDKKVPKKVAWWRRG